MTTTYVNPHIAFDAAIAAGVLTGGDWCDPGHATRHTWANYWAYVGTTDGRHAFKHLDTREYVYCPAK